MIRKRKQTESWLEVNHERIYNSSVLSSKIKHLRQDISYIKRKVGAIGELKTRQARLERLMKEIKESAESASERKKHRKEKQNPSSAYPNHGNC